MVLCRSSTLLPQLRIFLSPLLRAWLLYVFQESELFLFDWISFLTLLPYSGLSLAFSNLLAQLVFFPFFARAIFLHTGPYMALPNQVSFLTNRTLELFRSLFLLLLPLFSFSLTRDIRFYLFLDE